LILPQAIIQRQKGRFSSRLAEHRVACRFSAPSGCRFPCALALKSSCRLLDLNGGCLRGLTGSRIVPNEAPSHRASSLSVGGSGRASGDRQGNQFPQNRLQDQWQSPKESAAGGLPPGTILPSPPGRYHCTGVGQNEALGNHSRKIQYLCNDHPVFAPRQMECDVVLQHALSIREVSPNPQSRIGITGGS